MIQEVVHTTQLNTEEATNLYEAAEGNTAIIRALEKMISSGIKPEQAGMIARAITKAERDERASQEVRIVEKLNKELRDRKRWT